MDIYWRILPPGNKNLLIKATPLQKFFILISDAAESTQARYHNSRRDNYLNP